MLAIIYRTSHYASTSLSPHEKARFNKKTRDWVCEVHTIEDILAFADEDEIIVSRTNDDSPYDLEIEIYDDYRE